MKTTNILVSVSIACAISAQAFATDTSDNLLNSSEINKKEIASVLLKHGRNNKVVEANQDQTELQFTVVPKNKTMFKIVLPKGRNVEDMINIVSMN